MLGVALPPHEMNRVCCHLVLGSSPYVAALCLGSQCLIGEEVRNFYLLQRAQIGSEVHPASYFPGVNLTNHASNIEVNNVWSYISTPL